jgi:hypothetical protein
VISRFPRRSIAGVPFVLPAEAAEPTNATTTANQWDPWREYAAAGLIALVEHQLQFKVLLSADDALKVGRLILTN